MVNADPAELGALRAEMTHPVTECEISVLYRGIGLDDTTGQNYFTGFGITLTDMTVTRILMVTGGKILNGVSANNQDIGLKSVTTVSLVNYIMNVIGVSLNYTAEHRVSAGTRRFGVQVEYEDRGRGRTQGLA